AHPLAVVPDAAQCQAERRMNKPPRAEKDNEQGGEREGVCGVAVEIETESAENRPGMDALQAIETAGEPARTVRRFLQQQADAERDHDQWQMAKPGDDEARHIAE